MGFQNFVVINKIHPLKKIVYLRFFAVISLRLGVAIGKD